jgi:hypothetical protein
LLVAARLQATISPGALSSRQATVVGVEARPGVGGSGEHDPIEAVVLDRSPERIAVGAPTLDPCVQRHPELRRPVLDRL